MKSPSRGTSCVRRKGDKVLPRDWSAAVDDWITSLRLLGMLGANTAANTALHHTTTLNTIRHWRSLGISAEVAMLDWTLS